LTIIEGGRGDVLIMDCGEDVMLVTNQSATSHSFGRPPRGTLRFQAFRYLAQGSSGWVGMANGEYQ
jgi:hypothetical protein